MLLSRRSVLKVGALVLSGKALALATPRREGERGTVSITAWVRIGPDNTVTLIASQSEMGQGTTTTLGAALADELYLTLDQVSIAFGAFDPAYRDPVYNFMFT